MIEKIARQICLETQFVPGAPLSATDEAWEGYIPEALAALTALEQPSDEMVEAGCDHNFGPDVTGSDVRGSFGGQIVIQIWSRMTKAARGDQ
jgi:hypothetical protein